MSKLLACTLATAAVLSGCALEVKNLRPAEDLARAQEPPGSVYTGWRVFQDKCARCHGPAGTGTAKAPDLLPKVRTMGPTRFVGLVLTRYDWMVPPSQAGDRGAALDALVEQVVQRREFPMAMPEWQGEPRVNAHIVDLYAYLSARAQGAQGAGRPPG